MMSLQGHLLIASRELRDPNFSQTVVLLVLHGEEGAFGVVLNRPSPMSIKQVWEQLGNPGSERSEPLYHGGPCEGPLMVLHAQAELGESQVFEGLYYSASREHIEQLLESDTQQIQLFSGFAGWGPGQLESELEAGAWLSMPASLGYVFAREERELWLRAIKQVANDQVYSMLKIKHVPPDPSMN